MQKPVCIIGFGRLGETLANLLAPHKAITVLEVNATKQKQAKAAGHKLITLQDLANCPTIVLCVPISQFRQTLENMSPHIAPETLVMDTCSVKVFPVKVMKQALGNDVAIIATHPMFGPDSIKNGLANLSIVTWQVRGEPALYDQWNQFWQHLGLKVIQASPKEHDQITAYTLAMPHLFGRALGELGLKPQAIATVGYNLLSDVMRRTTNDSWQLFQDIQAYNPYAKQMRHRVRQAFQQVERKLGPNS